MSQIIDKLEWIDLETTGLSTKKDKIIEIAVLVTDTDLNLLDDNGYTGHVRITDEDVSLMSDFVKDMHTSNGLIEICRKSTLNLEDIDRQATEYISKFVKEKEAPLCGNNIAFDRSFIDYNMPLLSNYLHYRNIDVSTLKQLNQIWKEEKYDKGVSSHEAMDDIKGSIEELRYYKKKIFD
jgi:oligoribonuclease